MTGTTFQEHSFTTDLAQKLGRQLRIPSIGRTTRCYEVPCSQSGPPWPDRLLRIGRNAACRSVCLDGRVDSIGLRGVCHAIDYRPA